MFVLCNNVFPQFRIKIPRQNNRLTSYQCPVQLYINIFIEVICLLFGTIFLWTIGRYESNLLWSEDQFNWSKFSTSHFVKHYCIANTMLNCNGQPTAISLLSWQLETPENHLSEGGGSIRIEPSQQLLDDCTHKRNSKRKVGKPRYHWNRLFISFPKIDISKT